MPLLLARVMILAVARALLLLAAMGSPAPATNFVLFAGPLERFPAECDHSVDQKSLRIQKYEHILVDWVDSLHSVYALEAADEAKSYRVGDLVVVRPWSRPTPGGAKVVAGYMLIKNTGASSDRLVGGSTPIAGRFEIHASALTDGVMRMRRIVDGIEIPPGETVIFKPGGKHLMLGDLTSAVEDGEPFPATLIFEKAGPVTVEFSVGAPIETGDDAAP
ncbi:copper chaperone PCu(A)C [Methylocapsa palsarum]|uniref:Copper(I)-binding protein n=1 Tax=Methylocapsa palsarum TaxID=1612308 RepID=A0A1I3W8T6_9HYPH|nr:copper chaperone PCu(A)C [Methylocapsa palsarum]SFK03689.1 Copper(I)-binding protein [Methylocapsa palsarum]